MRGLHARVKMSEGQFLGPSYESRGMALWNGS